MAYSWWWYQVPLIGTALRAEDDKNYWEAYYRNTGFRPKYPGRSYGSYGSQLANQMINPIKNSLKR